MADTIFSKIIAGQIPCHKVYEDEQVLAFLDINPLSYGHTLIIPKQPAETLDALSDESAAALGRALPKVARGVLAATGAKAYNVLQNNGAGAHQAVFHVHFHIIPRYAEGAPPADLGAGLGIVWRPKHADANAAAELARKVAAAVR